MSGLHTNSRDNLRLTDAELRAVLAAMSQEDQLLSNLAKRQSRRFRLLPQHHVVLGYTPLGGLIQTIAPVVRDVSRGGLGGLHSSFMHVGTKVACLFVSPERRPCLRVAGEVVRCRHVRGNVHEIGVKFSDPAAIYPFVQVESDEQWLRSAGPYPGVKVALRRIAEMLEDGAPPEMLLDGLADVELAIEAERDAQGRMADPNTGTVDEQELDGSESDCGPSVEQSRAA
jgi:hypothetical protein